VVSDKNTQTPLKSCSINASPVCCLSSVDDDDDDVAEKVTTRGVGKLIPATTRGGGAIASSIVVPSRSSKAEAWSNPLGHEVAVCSTSFAAQEHRLLLNDRLDFSLSRASFVNVRPEIPDHQGRTTTIDSNWREPDVQIMQYRFDQNSLGLLQQLL